MMEHLEILQQDEIFYVIEGGGTILVDEAEVPVSAGSVVFVPAGARHGIRADAGSRLALTFGKGPGSTGNPKSIPR